MSKFNSNTSNFRAHRGGGVNRPQPKPPYAFSDATVGMAPTTSTGEATVLLRGAKGEQILAMAGIDGAATMDDDDVTNLNNCRGTSTTETRGAQGVPDWSTVSHDAASVMGSRELGVRSRRRFYEVGTLPFDTNLYQELERIRDNQRE
ncbi:uncharacterized protein DS421_14g473300 [Arachis hypogaea]|nr:uncharacterized protein DS421_14g473300 [Arachis hypogaea]